MNQEDITLIRWSKGHMKLWKKIENIIFVLICIGIIWGMVNFARGPVEHTMEFSAEKWLSVDELQRYQMLDDLYAKVELVGMTKEEVEKVLGVPDQYCGWYESDGDKYDDHWAYWVQETLWDGIVCLLINFKDGIVVDYELEQVSEL